jgi:hypothetical protein
MRDVALPTVADFFGVLLWFLFTRGYTTPSARTTRHDPLTLRWATWRGSNLSACCGERKTESRHERSTIQTRPLLHPCMQQQTSAKNKHANAPIYMMKELTVHKLTSTQEA